MRCPIFVVAWTSGDAGRGKRGKYYSLLKHPSLCYLTYIPYNSISFSLFLILCDFVSQQTTWILFIHRALFTAGLSKSKTLQHFLTWKIESVLWADIWRRLPRFIVVKETGAFQSSFTLPPIRINIGSVRRRFRISLNKFLNVPARMDITSSIFYGSFHHKWHHSVVIFKSSIYILLEISFHMSRTD